jgi:GMP synthase-like glutamine amidotransferase
MNNITNVKLWFDGCHWFKQERMKSQDQIAHLGKHTTIHLCRLMSVIIFVRAFVRLKKEKEMIVVVNNTLEQNLHATHATRSLLDFLHQRCITYVIVHDATSASGIICDLGRAVTGVIFSGSDERVMHQPNLVVLNTLFLLRCRVPVLGICFGHQIMALATGGNIDRLTHNRHELAPVKVSYDEAWPLFVGLEGKHLFYYNHQDCVTRINNDQWIPQSYDWVDGRRCIVAMKHTVRPWFGVQFHPELSGAPGRQLLDNFLMLCF